MRPDPKQIAALIRPYWGSTLSPLGAEDVHQAHYLMDICAELGVEASPLNVPHLISLMKELKLPTYRGDDYPKAFYTTDKYGRDVQARYPVGHPKNGLPVIFESAEEEAAWITGHAA